MRPIIQCAYTSMAGYFLLTDAPACSRSGVRTQRLMAMGLSPTRRCQRRRRGCEIHGSPEAKGSLPSGLEEISGICTSYRRGIMWHAQ